VWWILGLIQMELLCPSPNEQSGFW
jgi:hypothetical protein